MEIHKIKASETAYYTAYIGTDVEYVDPTAYYAATTVRMFRDMILDQSVGGATRTKVAFANMIAKIQWQTQYNEIKETKLPEGLTEVLTVTSKKEQVKRLQELKLEPLQLIRFIFVAADSFGYKFSQYTIDHNQTGIPTGSLPTITHIDGTEVKTVGETTLTEGQLKQSVEHKKRMIAKFLDKGNEWHCFFINHSSIAGTESWKGGQTHYHYISDKFGMSRSDVLKELMKPKYQLGSLPHIDLLGYGSQTGR